MERKESTNIWLIILIVILAVTTGYFAWKSQRPNQFKCVPIPEPEQQATTPPTTTPESTSIFYKNATYGFTAELPQTWKGYKIITEKWEGFVFNKDQTQNIKSTEGPKLSIRHPKWTAQVKRQDIPVLVFTIKQWNDLQAGTIHLDTAAPVLPSELARNTKYVFALPARYNFAFPEGNEEVDQLIQNKAVKAL
jgi:hypothetical protein